MKFVQTGRKYLDLLLALVTGVAHVSRPAAWFVCAWAGGSGLSRRHEVGASERAKEHPARVELGAETNLESVE